MKNVAVISTSMAVAGAVQRTRVPFAGESVPAEADHMADLGNVISTCSPTPTALRVSGVPSGAGRHVFVTIGHVLPSESAGAIRLVTELI